MVNEYTEEVKKKSSNIFKLNSEYLLVLNIVQKQIMLYWIERRKKGKDEEKKK